MKPEISAAAEFLSRVFLTHDGVTKEKIADFQKHLAAHLEDRFVNHWHESSPTKGQAFRCIRVCPEEALDPILEKVCHEVGINTGDFQLPIELTLWVDPTEVVCKFGDLKCSYHTVAKKDESSGTLDNQAHDLDIDDLVENARELYLKKQSVVIHPINSSEMHIPYSDGSTNGFTMAIRMNGTMHYNMVSMNGANGGSLGNGNYDGSPRGKTRAPHSMHHKRGGSTTFHYYGKSSGGKGGPHYMQNGSVTTSSPSGSGNHQGYPHHRNNHSHHHHHHHQGHHQAHHHHHHHGSQHHHQHTMGSSPYSNSYLNGYVDENGGGYMFDQRSGSPTKMNGLNHPPPPLTGNNGNGSGQITQSSPTPEQIQQQMLHPPPMPPHLQQAFSAGHPPTPDTTTLPPPPPPPSSSSAVVSSSSSAVTSNIGNNNNSIMTTPNGKSTNASKYPNTRNGGMGGPRNKQGSPAKDMK